MLLLRIADINRNPLTDSFPENFYCVLPYIFGVVQTFVRAKQDFRQYWSIPHQVTECRWPHAFWHFVINPYRMRFPIHPYSDFEFFRIYIAIFHFHLTFFLQTFDTSDTACPILLMLKSLFGVSSIFCPLTPSDTGGL